MHALLPRWSPLLFAAFFACPVSALELRRSGELRMQSIGSVDSLGAGRFVRMSTEWERTPQSPRTSVTFVLADTQEQKVLRLRVPLLAIAKTHPSLFSGLPDATLVHFDGARALLRFDRREPLRTVFHFAVWDVARQQLTEPKPLGGVVRDDRHGSSQARQVTELLGVDPAGTGLYFAELSLDDKPNPANGPLAARLFRLTFPELHVDWELQLPLPRRAQQLAIGRYTAFSSDGKRLALAEYYDSAIARVARASPPPQVYVVEIQRRKVATFPIGRTPYGLAFSRDGRFLAVGSNEDEEIVRIDLTAGKIDRRAKVGAPVSQFAATRSGASLLVKTSPRGTPGTLEVRRWSDLKLQETVSLTRLLPPRSDVRSQGVQETSDGRLVVWRVYRPEATDSTNSEVVTYSAEEGALATRQDPAAMVQAHVRRNRLRLYSYALNEVGNQEQVFAPIVGNAQGDALVIGTKSDLPEDAPFQEGKSHPYVIWVDAKGKVVWERSLRTGGFVEFQGASALAAPDGTFLVYLLAYVHAGAHATARVVKVNRKGEVLWTWTSPTGKDSRFAARATLEPSGNVRMHGHVGGGRAGWRAELDSKTGRLIRDEIGPKLDPKTGK